MRCYALHMHFPRTILLSGSVLTTVLFVSALVPEQTNALIWTYTYSSSSSSLKVRHPERKKIRQSILREAWRSRNDQRREDLKLISNALYNYRREHGDENIPGILLDTDKEICRPNALSCAGLLDLQEALRPYMKKIPSDPLVKSGNSTRYTVQKDWKGRVHLTAPDAEEDWSIRQMH